MTARLVLCLGDLFVPDRASVRWPDYHRFTLTNTAQDIPAKVIGDA